MARTEPPSLSDGNKLYLYDLLKREIGTGRQTFLPRIEEALAGERLTGGDLGFDDTRALMEALGETVSLTVFKGGRVYATVRPMPAWDEALAAAAAPRTAGAAGRPWKRKRGATALKPQRPRRVKRDEAATADAGADAGNDPARVLEDVPADAPIQADARGGSEAASEEARAESPAAGRSEPAPTGDAGVPEPPASSERTGSGGVPRAASEAGRGGDVAEEAGHGDGDAPAGQAATEVAPGRPPISLTVTYDPETDRAGETVLAAEEAAGRDAVASPSDGPADGRRDAGPVPPPAPEPGPRPAAPRPGAAIGDGAAGDPDARARRHAPRPVCLDTVPSKQALASYPRDFATEVHIPGPLQAALAQIMPLNANVADELSRDFRAARGLGEVRGTRARAVFPLRFDGGGRAVAVAIKRTPQAMRPWAVNFIDRIEDTALARVGVEGLPLLSPAEAAIRELAMRAYLDPAALERLARGAWPPVWDADAFRAQLAFALRETELAADSFPTGLHTSTGSALLAAFEETGEDIPWRLTGPSEG